MDSSSPPDRDRRRAAIVLGASAVLFVAYAHYFTHQVGDDSFIYFRYAENVARGYGPVWNRGEHVEAFSSPLWMLLLAVARLCGLACTTFARVAGPLAAACAIALGYRSALALGASRLAAAIAVLFCALDGSIHFWAPSGLETPLYMATFGVVALGIARGDARAWAIGTALVGVSRPEGPAMAAWCVAVAVWTHGPRFVRAKHLAIALLPVGAYLAFRLAYYGVPLPNTYYAKATGPLGKRLELGDDYVLWIGSIAAVCLALTFAKPRDDRARRERGVLFLVGAVVGIAMIGGGDWMWGRRLLTPVMAPLFAVVAAQSSRLALLRRRGWRAIACVALSFLAINDDLPWLRREGIERWFTIDGAEDDLHQPGHFLALRFVDPAIALGRALTGRVMPGGDRQEGTMTEVSADVARWISARHSPDALVAVNHAGAVPFFLPNPCLDMVGLADAHLAREVRGAMHEKLDPDYVLSRKPEVVVLNTRTRPGTDGVWYHEGYWEGETALVHAPEFQAKYRAAPAYFTWSYTGPHERYVVVYERVPDPT